MKLSKNMSSVAVLYALLYVPPIATGDEGKIEIKVIQGLRLSWGDSRDNMTQLGVTRGAVTLKVAVEDMAAGSTRVIWLKAEIPDSTPPIVDFKRVHVTAGRVSTADFTDIKAPDTARRTYDYWVEVRDALRRGSPGKNPAPARLATSLKDSSKRLSHSRRVVLTWRQLRLF